jgi:alkylhydroperoxidase/carboxymuconolactone decarboxylase family protein
MSDYYDSGDLEDFPRIADYAAQTGKAFFDYYAKVFAPGALDERTKSLIALAVAHTEKCPYCIDAYTNACLSLGISEDAIFEAIHVGASIKAGAVLAHATQARKIIRKKEM